MQNGKLFLNCSCRCYRKLNASILQIQCFGDKLEFLGSRYFPFYEFIVNYGGDSWKGVDQNEIVARIWHFWLFAARTAGQ